MHLLCADIVVGAEDSGLSLVLRKLILQCIGCLSADNELILVKTQTPGLLPIKLFLSSMFVFQLKYVSSFSSQTSSCCFYLFVLIINFSKI